MTKFPWAEGEGWRRVDMLFLPATINIVLLDYCGACGDVGGGVLVVRLELLAAGCQTSLRARTQCDQSRHPQQQNVDMQRPSEELGPELS